ncbi:hypothetical protein COCC4DRAFT_60270 [Bipolaris maydis ATCC 48331]|uniref:Uncharacterized protein n=2 Tax=Cochliobolus heterostrophus TaxID=5016 RepID=M2SZY7_COCH5|nr:uncharacterized protein COCC4DRAFT_60270 [Bipolaris maydis ATCC 48331]EMD90915.1 hypothetical protein COCHEDRAFT_1030686 [Bipolaris maydis C5]KAJ5022657.1 hypothetical protein J3E73DRAFT_373943 [Bipolaris maydis]ENI06001.1 hypothetical protein COCC4DRAFT_60270 [Bipolaris maydis ATCC 48331]KAJ5064672.1 hypothetical protein J3E74DRAFT_403107 [Bipolaris maydis]KAJ6193316.1 hypothetical protein J3E72DRAFT_378895 [Bipolaris maydis]
MAAPSTGVPWAIPARSKLRPSTLRRHASAPAESSTEIWTTGQENTTVGKPPSALYNLPPVHSLQNQSLLSEIAATQALTTHLRRDRDAWRTLAQEHSKALNEANRKLKDREHMISELQKSKASLKFQCDTSEALNSDLSSCLKEATMNLDEATKMLEAATTKRDHLASQLDEAKANMTKLRRSDRTKEKTQQQNLHLKALLHHQSAKYNNNTNTARYNNNTNTARYTTTTTTAKRSTTATLRSATTALNQDMLQSALSSAMERIDSLEARGGQALLDAPEEQG